MKAFARMVLMDTFAPFAVAAIILAVASVVIV